jgi:hypothetical protein
MGRWKLVEFGNEYCWEVKYRWYIFYRIVGNKVY